MTKNLTHSMYCKQDDDTLIQRVLQAVARLQRGTNPSSIS